MHKRILAIDYGKKRTGLAVSDPLQIIASPLDTVETGNLFAFLANYISLESVETIVFGNPKRLDGTDNDIKKEIVLFESKLKQHFPDIKTVWLDERFTSKIALQSMIQSGYTKRERRDKANIDKVSATIILQDYMQWK